MILVIDPWVNTMKDELLNGDGMWLVVANYLLPESFVLSAVQVQCSCLENPRDGGAWWAAIYAVAQSRTRLKRLSSSSSSQIRLKSTQEQVLLKALIL